METEAAPARSRISRQALREKPVVVMSSRRMIRSPLMDTPGAGIMLRRWVDLFQGAKSEWLGILVLRIRKQIRSLRP